jgi:hypothetical protein
LGLRFGYSKVKS